MGEEENTFNPAIEISPTKKVANTSGTTVFVNSTELNCTLPKEDLMIMDSETINANEKNFDFAKSVDSGTTWQNYSHEITFDRLFNDQDPYFLVGNSGIINVYSGMFFLRSTSQGINWTDLVDIDNLDFFEYSIIDDNGTIYGIDLGGGAYWNGTMTFYKSY